MPAIALDMRRGEGDGSDVKVYGATRGGRSGCAANPDREVVPWLVEVECGDESDIAMEGGDSCEGVELDFEYALSAVSSGGFDE